MVRLEEVEDETLSEKPATTKHDELLADDDEDFTDTDSEISDSSDVAVTDDESIFERVAALKDMVPPQTRAKISSVVSSISSTVSTVTNASMSYGGKGLWILGTSVILLGFPYGLLINEEAMFQEQEKQQAMMQEGASGMIGGGEQSGGEAKAAL